MDNAIILRAIINGQSAIKQELLKKIDKLDQKTGKGFKEAKNEILENRKRIDKFGHELAELSDDAPTREEHDGIEKRVSKLETKIVSN